MPTSRRLAARPCIVILPFVGSVIRQRSFSSVDLPAPLRPMMPIRSPCSTSNETSSNALNSSSSTCSRFGLSGWRRRWSRLRPADIMLSRNVL
ncbi:MAG: hypothetical protein V8T87_04460 [Victivallales bacterium]